MQRARTTGGALTLDDLRNSAERRKEPRFPHEREIVILPCASPQEWTFRTVHLYDCSRHGIGIITTEPFKRGDEFLAKLKVKRMTMVLYRVCHCEQLEDGRFKIGANLVEFVGTPAEILDALLTDDEKSSGEGDTAAK
jgi:hypothetical protein